MNNINHCFNTGRFYGVAEGEVVVMGAAEFRTTRTFGAFWVRGERVVGAFLEGGTVEQQIAVAQVKIFE